MVHFNDIKGLMMEKRIKTSTVGLHMNGSRGLIPVRPRYSSGKSFPVRVFWTPRSHCQYFGTAEGTTLTSKLTVRHKLSSGNRRLDTPTGPPPTHTQHNLTHAL